MRQNFTLFKEYQEAGNDEFKGFETLKKWSKKENRNEQFKWMMSEIQKHELDMKTVIQKWRHILHLSRDYLTTISSVPPCLCHI